MERRVVVTGMGAITPIGNNVETFWNNVKAGVLGIDEITKFDTTDYSAKLAAEVKDFNAKEVLGFKQAKRLSPFSQYAVAVSYTHLDVYKRQRQFRPYMCLPMT